MKKTLAPTILGILVVVAIMALLRIDCFECLCFRR